jgi:multimeric flavodoxin WrbA
VKALIMNCTLKPSPSESNTEALARVVQEALESHEVEVEMIRAVDHTIHRGLLRRRRRGCMAPVRVTSKPQRP